jgi:hypothetical protein
MAHHRSRVHLGGATVLGAALLLGGCGTVQLPQGGGGGGGATTASGSATSESRTVSGFTTVQLGGIGEVRIQQTGTESLTVTADAAVLPLVTSEVSGGVLRLGVKDNTSFDDRARIIYTVTARDLAGLDLGGSGTMNATGITTSALTVRIAGSGAVTTAGSADSQTVDMAGSGAYHGLGLLTTTSTVRSAGSGSVEVAARDRLDVTILGSGTVAYSGSPQVQQSIIGSGTITKK